MPREEGGVDILASMCRESSCRSLYIYNASSSFVLVSF